MKKQIKDFPNYEVYDNGDVVNIVNNKKLMGSISENGYRYYRLTHNGIKKMLYAHRLVAEAFILNLENKPVVNHIDGNKLNNNIENLEWATYSENSVHAHASELIKSRRISEYYQEDLEDEEWKKIIDSHYSISSKGRVRNDNSNLLLKPSITCGYYKVRLSKNGLIQDVMLHHLVYENFIGERKDDMVINHIDGDKLNNDKNNLEQITLSENVLSALYDTQTNHSSKKVGQYDLEGNFLKEFPSARMAARELNLDSSTISKVCRGKNKTHGRFIFKYL